MSDSHQNTQLLDILAIPLISLQGEAEIRTVDVNMSVSPLKGTIEYWVSYVDPDDPLCLEALENLCYLARANITDQQVILLRSRISKIAQSLDNPDSTEYVKKAMDFLDVLAEKPALKAEIRLKAEFILRDWYRTGGYIDYTGRAQRILEKLGVQLEVRNTSNHWPQFFQQVLRRVNLSLFQARPWG